MNGAADGITIRPYVEGDAQATLDVFLRAVRLTASADYDADEIAAWAPDDIDLAGWHRRRSAATT
jgi:putative acetyltransferase